MSKLDALAEKIAEKLLPKMRMMVREELDYALSHGSDKKVMTDKKGSPSPDNPDLTEVVRGMKNQFKKLNGTAVVDPHETFEDESGKVHRMGDLMNNEGAQRIIQNIQKDYSSLID